MSGQLPEGYKPVTAISWPKRKVGKAATKTRKSGRSDQARGVRLIKSQFADLGMSSLKNVMRGIAESGTELSTCAQAWLSRK